MSDNPDHPELLPIATAISYAGADLAGFARGQRWCGALSILLAMLSLLVSGAVGLTEGLSVRRVQQSISGQPARIALLNQQRQKMQANAVAAQKWLDQQAGRPPLRGLTESEADALAGTIQDQNVQLNDAQIAAFKRELQRAGQQLIDPDIPYSTSPVHGNAQHQAQQITRRRSNDTVTIDVQHIEPFGFAAVATLKIDAEGKVLSRHVEKTAAATTRYSTLPPVTAASLSSTSQTWRLWQALASLLATMLNFALAVMLLLAGIAALQRRAVWIRMHRQYAIAKIAAVLLTAACMYWGFGSSRDGIGLKIAGVYALSASLYPLSLRVRLP